MSDLGRKDFSTKVKEGMTPDVMKSDVDKAKEATTGASDHIAREVMPDSGKSDKQEAVDKSGRAKDDVKHDTIGDKVKHALGMDNKNTH